MDWREQVINMAQQAAGFTPAPTTTVTAQPPFSAGVHLQPQFDVIERLPPAAADKLRALRQRSDDQHAIIPAGEDVRLANMARVEAAAALSRLTNHPQEFGFNLKPDDPRVIAAQRHLDKMTADAKRLTELQESRVTAWRAASTALAACEDFLRHGAPGNCKLEAVEVEPPKLNKGETVIEAIERYRRRGRELRADQHRIRSAPYPSAYAKQRMRAQVEALAMQGAPSVSSLIELDGKIEFQTQRLTSEVHAERRSLAFTDAPDATALVAWLHKDALIAALDREIASEADDKAALSHEARQKAEAETMADLLSVERDESWFVWQAQAQGLPIEHRADISPLAILQVQLITTPRADASPETSPGLSWPMRR
ncbi:hypothetical protein [Bradyrhizobium septentrionale]|uniref:Bartonella effector protein BID domain-containing protein n=1 Tax=Bradyrhizobium septentrionale TaxID=1404411 RepID=A0ABZ2NSR4_9BRAD